MDARHTHEARHMGSAAPGWILGAVGVALLALGRTLGRPVYRGMADMGTED